VFAIELQPARKARSENGRPPQASGRIMIGDFTETFRVPLGFWDEAGYRRSWRCAFDVLSAGPYATACLMTAMTDPSRSNFLACWPLYREGERVHVQITLIFPGETGKRLDPAAPWDHVRPRRETDEHGSKIPEWTTTMNSLREFFSQPACTTAEGRAMSCPCVNPFAVRQRPAGVV
jgi:hypothetical protein